MILFGASISAGIAIQYFLEKNEKIEYICDTYKSGIDISGIKVFNIKKLKHEDKTKQIVICNSGWETVAENLKDMGFNNLFVFRVQSNIPYMSAKKFKVIGEETDISKKLVKMYLDCYKKELDAVSEESALIRLDSNYSNSNMYKQEEGYFEIWYEKYNNIIDIKNYKYDKSYKLTIQKYFGAGAVRKPFYVVYNSGSSDCLVSSVRRNYPMYLEARLLLDILSYQETEKVLIDLGANIGIVSMIFAAEGYKVFAAEAGKENAIMLSMAANINNYSIMVTNQAVWNYTGTLYFKENGVSGKVVKDGGGRNTNCVKCFALDDWKKVKEWHNLKKVSLIKMDIEGSEINAIAGAEKFLKEFSYPPVYCESNKCTLFEKGYKVKDLFDIFSKNGYVPYILHENGLMEVDIEELQPKTVQDYLFVHNKERLLIKKMYGKMQKEEIRKLLLNEIKTMPIEYVNMTLESLKDFSEYCNDDEIKGYIK